MDRQRCSRAAAMSGKPRMNTFSTKDWGTRSSSPEQLPKTKTKVFLLISGE